MIDYSKIGDIFYDWAGANLKIFLFINKLFVKYSFLQDFFHYYNKIGKSSSVLLLFSLIASGVLIYAFFKRMHHDKLVFSKFILKWFETILIMFISACVLYIAIPYIKEAVNAPRPMCILQKENVNVILEDIETYDSMYKRRCLGKDQSFPSAHAAISALFTAGLWRVFGFYSRIALVALQLLMGLSRIATGVHFPVDIVAGYLFATIIVIFIRNIFDYSKRKFFVYDTVIAKNINLFLNGEQNIK